MKGQTAQIVEAGNYHIIFLEGVGCCHCNCDIYDINYVLFFINQ